MIDSGKYAWLVTLAMVVSVGLAIELPSKCGRNYTSVAEHSQWRIVGGREAHLGQFPWQVYLNKTLSFDGFEMQADCGATIVNKDWIMTAAHCVFDVTNDTQFGIKVSFEAVFGTVNLNLRAGTEVRRSISKIVRHEKFDYDKRQYDIALLKLNASLNFETNEKHLSPICLPKMGSEFFNNCYSTGFGYEDQGMSVNDNKLHLLQESTVDESKCRHQFPLMDSKSNICIGGVNNHGACKGDSGSPYQCYDSKQGRWYQMGLVSYGVPCALKDVPDVLTRVAFHYDWIVKQQ